MKFTVLREGRQVLRFEDTPGQLLSTATRPPGFTPPSNPFITGQALDPNAEDTLAGLLEQSSSADDFVNRLQKHGFEVQRAG